MMSVMLLFSKKLKFTPLEFETRGARRRGTPALLLNFTPLEF